MKRQLFFKAKKGFTLMEVIIVIAILAILAAVAVPLVTGHIEEGKRVKDLQIAKNYMDGALYAVMMKKTPRVASTNYEWYVFKWGYSTDNKNNMNMHIAEAGLTNNGLPNINSAPNGRDEDMQEYIADYLRWTNEAGEIEIPRPESKDVQSIRGKGQSNSLVFYVNVNTYEVLVDERYSTNWIDKVGINAELTPDYPEGY